MRNNIVGDEHYGERRKNRNNTNARAILSFMLAPFSGDCSDNPANEMMMK